MSRPQGAREGSALFMVLLLTGVLFTLSLMLPQILVQASGGIRINHGRDHLMDALDSGVAFAEARLKRNITAFVTNPTPRQQGRGASPPPDDDIDTETPGASLSELSGWLAHPTYDNPDYGPRHDLTFEVRCARAGLFRLQRDPTTTTYQFSYTLIAGAWSPKDPTISKQVEVNGVVTAVTSSRVPHALQDIKIQGINRETPGGYVPLRGSPPPFVP